MITPTATILDGFVDKHISKICGCSFTNDAENHCAHFVCHVTELTFGLTCFAMSGKGDQSKSANIRVQEVFPRCRSVGTWASKPSHLLTGFIFVTQAGNVNIEKKTIENVPKKHIGIFVEQDVWQYKNKLRHVIKQTPEDFKKHYSGTGFEIFYGEFPL
jgi:hypothetical protein